MALSNNLNVVPQSLHEFTEEHAKKLRDQIFSLGGDPENVEISWRDGESTAKIKISSQTKSGTKLTVWIHGEYWKLRDRLQQVYAE